MDTLGIDEDSAPGDAWLSFPNSPYSLHGLAHRDNLNQPRPMASVLAAWDKFLVVLDAVVDALERRALRWHQVADELVALEAPTAHAIQQLKQHLPNNTAFRGYFFGNLTSALWLKPLHEEGFFDLPPAAHRDEDGATSFPPWPELQYLVRLMKDDSVHKAALAIALEVPQTENLSVRSGLIEIALGLPPVLSVQLASRIAQDARTPYLMLIDDKLSDLVRHLCVGGYSEQGMEIATSLLAIRTPAEGAAVTGVRGNIDAHDYGEALSTIVGPLTKAAGIRAVDFFADLLTRSFSVGQSTLAPSREGLEDYSVSWRPAIEDHEQNGGRHDIRSLLAEATRDAAIGHVVHAPSQLEPLLAALKARPGSVFARICLHVLLIHGRDRLDLIENWVTDDAIAGDPRLMHEFALLIGAYFGQLSNDARSAYFDRIEAGPGGVGRGQAESEYQADAEDEVIADRWRLRLLEFVRDMLPPDWARRRDELVLRVGEIEHPTFLSYWTLRAGGGSSPRAEDDLQKLSVEELTAFVEAWQPPDQNWNSPSIEGLARSVRSVVRADPARFSQEAIRFLGLGPAYVWALLEGLREAVERGAEISWRSVLELARKSSWEMPGAPAASNDRSTDLEAINVSIIRLMSAGMQSAGSGMTIALRRQVWEAIVPYTDGPEPPSEGLELSVSELVTRSMNTTRGEAMHAVLHYAAWVRGNVQESSPDEMVAGFALIPEVREVLERHLDSSRDASLVVRAVYGVSLGRLAWLDLEWLSHSLVRIFPARQDQRELRDAAWWSYITYCEPDAVLFPLLAEQYMLEVDCAGNREGAGGKRDVLNSLADHIMIAFWHGWVSFDADDGLLMRYLEGAADDVQGHAIDMLGRSLLGIRGPLDSGVQARLEQLWDRRVAVVEHAPSLHVEEAAAFGSWFASGLLDSETSLRLLGRLLKMGVLPHMEHAVVERLSKVFAEYPIDALECLEMLMENDTEGWSFWGWRDEARPLFEAAMMSVDPKVVDLARELINKLGSRGFLDYRDLIP